MEEKLICALLVGKAETKKKVEHIARSYENCPYINLMATRENQLFATFFLPEKQRWWIEYAEKEPRKTFGLEKAKITIVEEVQYPKQLKMRLPEKPKKIAPCEAECKTCPAYEKCLCCPATIFYKSAQHKKVS